MRNAFYALNAKTWDDNNKPWINIEIGKFFDSLWIKLQHNGKSLTEEEQLDIFQPFFSLNDHSSFPVEKRLSYSYFIITDHHRGQMAVTSDDENGTCFNIQLALK